MTVSASLKSGGPASPEAALFLQAQAGCRQCVEQLMVSHEGLIHAVIRQQTTLGPLSYAEAVQAGRLGLWRAILGFDPRRGQAFSTYAWPCIMHRVWNEVKMARRADRRAHSPDACQRLALPRPTEEDWPTLRHEVLVRLAVRRLLARLPRRLALIVAVYYGFGDSPPASFATVGTALGLSGEGVRLLHTQALVWLRHPAHSQELRALLGGHSLAEYEAADGQAQRWRQRRGHRHGRSM